MSPATVLLAVAVVAAAASAQDLRKLTLEDVLGGSRGAALMLMPRAPSGSFEANGDAIVSRAAPKGTERVKVDLTSLEERVVGRGSGGEGARPERGGARRGDRTGSPLRVREGRLEFAAEDGQVKVLVEGGDIREAHAAPGGAAASYVLGNDLYVRAIAEDDTWRVTSDGGENVMNGVLDWVYQEEVYGRGNFQGHWWSPTGTHVAFLRLDESAVKPFTVIDHVPNNDLAAERAVVAEVTKYPKAGDPNPTVGLSIADVAKREVVDVDLSRWSKDDEILIVRVAWQPDGSAALVQVQNRIQDWLELVAVDAKSGAIRPILRETSTSWVNVLEQPRFLADGTFLWWSERNGYQNLYRYRLDGTLVATIAEVEFVMNEIEHVDEAAGLLWLRGRSESALDSHLYRVGLDGKGLTRLTTGSGTHSVTFSPDRAHFFDLCSHVDRLPELRLCTADGSIKTRWATTSSPDFAAIGGVDPELVSIPARDGFPLDATVLVPTLAPGASAPIWIDTYSGPDAPTVRGRYSVSTWHQFLRQQGVIVLQCNVRSASGRGQAATAACHKQLLVSELRDLEDAIDWVVKHRGGDAARVGITGFSYGGSMSAFAVTHSKKFALAVAGAGVYDWQLYDTIYTERYMQTPQKNPSGYAATSVIGAAKDLHGHLVLVHGTMDDNVHLQNTLRFAYALQVAGKDFEMMLYPRSRHGIGGPLRGHMQRLTWRAIERHLLGRA
ncbi:MAG: DPP IV N-terminal domain-containing protein [Planctomycetota bacterium]